MRTMAEQSKSPPQAMADSLSYAPTHYIPPAVSQQYYAPPPPSHVNHGHVHVVSPPPRPDPTQRKRPKYTRSKTGCLTCRVKKIKCDETKPNCMRCTHGQRDCTWPEGVPTRKKAVARKESAEARPSTAGSSGISESSTTPPTREPTPPRRSGDIGLMPLQTRRTSDTYLPLPPMPSVDPNRRHIGNGDRPSGYAPQPNPNSNVLTMIPDPVSYPAQHRYESYASAPQPGASRHTLPPPYRPPMTHPVSQWSPTEPIDPYFSSIQERNLVGHNPSSDAHTRYQ
ncbi:hypothetical protein AX16_005220 [Volvariella volvacea WC 439]|nr:hypothetical protein AX16_005220 [Volvariella volvacea WC 439]